MGSHMSWCSANYDIPTADNDTTNRKYKDYVYKKMLVQENLKK